MKRRKQRTIKNLKCKKKEEEKKTLVQMQFLI